MRRLAIALLAACGHVPAPVDVPPPTAPRIRVVRCQPAVAAPRIPTRAPDDDVGESYGSLLGATSLTGEVATPRTPMVSIGAAIATASIGDVSIRRYLRQRLPQIRDCYGAELAGAPELHGTVVATFAIGVDGSVIGATASGLHPKVAACVATAIGAIAFPHPPAAIARVSYPFVFDSEAHAASSLPQVDEVRSPWTPFAAQGDPDIAEVRAASATRAAEAQLEARKAELEACFPRPAPTGSLRAMLDVIADGAITGVRVGGLGDVGVEACIAEVLGDLQLVVPPGAFVELACDLSRGDARPWRVTPAGYGRIDVSRGAVRFGDTTIAPHAEDPTPLPAGTTYLVVAEPDAPGEMIDLALAWAADGDATLLAVPDGDGLRFVGAARNTLSIETTADVTGTVHPSLIVQAGNVRSCVDRTEAIAPIADRATLDVVLRDLATRCRRRDCATTLGIALERDVPVRNAIVVADAARRAGFERVLLGAYSTCRVR